MAEDVDNKLCFVADVYPRRELIDSALTTYARLAVEANEVQHQEALVDQRVIGHGEGQEHAIADVNAGLIDDLIQPRLRLAVEQERERLRGQVAALGVDVRELKMSAHWVLNRVLALLTPEKETR
jgi:hypothetical protein